MASASPTDERTSPGDAAQEVVLVAYVNEEALRRSVETSSAVFWSTSRNELWEKGKSSGESFELVGVLINCQQNSLVYRLHPGRGGICHTKNGEAQARNCCYRRLSPRVVDT